MGIDSDQLGPGRRLPVRGIPGVRRWLASTSLSTQALLGGLALAALGTGAHAASMTWVTDVVGNYRQKDNWSGGARPTASDTATVSSGNSVLGRPDDPNVGVAGTLNLTGGILTIRPGSVLSVTNLFSITGGTLTGATGTVTLTDAAGTVTQSGGLADAIVTTPSYTLTGGSVGAAATINFSSSFAISSTGVVDAGGDLIGGAGSTMTQAGADSKMGGTVTGITSYGQSGGEMGSSVTAPTYTLSGGTITASGVVSFSTLFDMTDGTVAAGAQLIGGPLMTQSGGTMGGTATAITYTHSGGSITGIVNAGTYSLTDAAATSEAGATITASTAFALSPASGTMTVGAKLSGAGNLTKSGASAISLGNAGNDYTGTTTINGGLLSLAGTLTGDVTVNSGGTLGGTASLGNTTIEAGGILAPGNSIGTLTTATVTWKAGAFYDVEVDDAGNSDKTAVTGLATLAGKVRVTAASGVYAPSTSYTILSAGSISGTFDPDVIADLAFLDPTLSYDPTHVYLKLMRNDLSFVTVGVTANGKAAAAAAETLGSGNPIFDAIMLLTQGDAEKAFHMLSGEGHASFASAFLQNAGQVGDILRSRFDHSFGGSGRTTIDLTAFDGEIAPAGAADGGRRGLWLQLYGAQGNLQGDGTARLESRTGGFAAGLDGRLGDWLVGLAVHTGGTSGTVGALATEAKSTDYGAGLYAGTGWGATRLSFGALVTHHEIRSSRNVVFPGVDETLTADYGADTAQAFVRLSHGLDFRGVSITPFADAAYVRHATGAFTESGGDAALSSAAKTIDAAFTTLGLGIGKRFMAGETPLALRGSLGWRHAFAGAPEASHAFAGGTSFTVVGAPIASDLLVVSAGLSMDFAGDARFGIAYDGQIGADLRSQALKATWSLKF